MTVKSINKFGNSYVYMDQNYIVSDLVDEYIFMEVLKDNGWSMVKIRSASEEIRKKTIIKYIESYRLVDDVEFDDFKKEVERKTDELKYKKIL